jgi:integrase/recombinase XerC
MNWSQAVDGFGRHIGIERALSPNTRRAYESDVRQLTVHTGADIAPAKLDADHVRAWLASLHRRRSPATMGRKLASVRCFFRWMVRESVRLDDPTAGIPMPKLEKRLPRPLSVDDCEQLITRDERVSRQPAPEGGKRARRMVWMTLRDRALVELLYGTGIRVGELVALDVRDLELRAQEIRVMGKGGKERIVPIPEQAREALAAWLDVRRHAGLMSEPLFISLRVRREEKPRRLAAREARRILGERARRADLDEHVHPWIWARICGRSRNCSGTRVSLRRRSTQLFRSNIFGRSMIVRIPGQGKREWMQQMPPSNYRRKSADEGFFEAALFGRCG